MATLAVLSMLSVEVRAYMIVPMTRHKMKGELICLLFRFDVKPWFE